MWGRSESGRRLENAEYGIHWYSCTNQDWRDVATATVGVSFISPSARHAAADRLIADVRVRCDEWLVDHQHLTARLMAYRA